MYANGEKKKWKEQQIDSKNKIEEANKKIA